MGKMMGYGLVVLLAVAVGYFAHMSATGIVGVRAAQASMEVTYSDLVAVNMTVLGMIVAVAGIALAVAGVVGWNSIEGKALSTAEAATRANLDDETSSLHRIIKKAISDPDSPLHQTLRAEIQRAMFAGVQDVAEDTDEPNEGEDAAAADGETKDAS